MYSNVGQAPKLTAPGKRMKKRRELDALLVDRTRGGLYQPMHRSTIKSNGFGNSTHGVEASFAPMKQYGNYSKRNMRGSQQDAYGCTSKKVFHICLPTCVLALLAACVTSSVGIVWMQVQLKADLDRVQDRIFKIERWKSDQPSTIADLQSAANQLQQDVVQLQQFTEEIPIIKSQLNSLNIRIEKQNGLDYSQVITSIQSQIADLQNGVIDTSTKISNLRQSVQELETANRITDSKTSQLFQDLEQNLVKKSEEAKNDETSAEKQRIDSIVLKMDKIEQTVEEVGVLKQRVTSLDEKQVTFEKHVETMTQELKSLNVSVSTLKSGGAAFGTRLSQAERSLLQLRKQQSSKYEQQAGDQKTTGEEPQHKAHRQPMSAEQQLGVKSNKPTPSSGRLEPSHNSSPPDADAVNPADRHTPPEVHPSHGTGVRMGDTTTSFTELPTGKQRQQDALRTNGAALRSSKDSSNLGNNSEDPVRATQPTER